MNTDKNKALYSRLQEGMIFGNLTLLNKVAGKDHIWTCECTCGSKLDVTYGYLNGGLKTSCGCATRKSERLKLKVGQRFTRLTVKKLAYREDYRDYYECICDCGSMKIASAYSLVDLDTKSCGCLFSESSRDRQNAKFLDKLDSLIGQKFDMLTIIGIGDVPFKKGKAVNFRNTVKCRCDCGNVKDIIFSNILLGDNKSCGCMIQSVSNGGRNGLPEGEAAFNVLYCRYKAGAKARSLKFDLDKVTFRKFVISDCFYCGKPPSRKAGNNPYQETNGCFVYNGIDRTMNSVGYTIENCVTCCAECNYLKGARDIDDFILHINQIVKHLKDKGAK